MNEYRQVINALVDNIQDTFFKSNRTHLRETIDNALNDLWKLEWKNKEVTFEYFKVLQEVEQKIETVDLVRITNVGTGEKYEVTTSIKYIYKYVRIE